MKKKIIALLCMAGLTCMLLTGCSGTSGQAEPSEETVSETEETPEADKTNEAEEASETDETEEAPEADKTDDVEAEAAEPSAVLEDGVYTAEFDTDNSMFRVNEACDGKGTLTVQDGKMVIHVSLVSKNIVNLYSGLAEDAKKDGAALIEPTTDEVTYSDGITEEVYGFDIPVPVLDEEFDVALIGKKGTWYDHKVIVSNPEKTE